MDLQNPARPLQPDLPFAPGGPLDPGHAFAPGRPLDAGHALESGPALEADHALFDTGIIGPPPPGRAPLALKPAAAIAAFALLFILALWASLWAFLHDQNSADIRAQKRLNENLARALEDPTARALAALDQALLRVKRDAESHRRDPDLGRAAAETGLLPSPLIQLSLLGRDGLVIATTADGERPRQRPAGDADRDDFRALAEHDSGGLLIGAPVKDRSSGRVMLPLSRRINTASGAFDGVVTASIDPAWLAAIYGQVELGREGVVFLTGLDGTVRARSAGGSEFEGVSPLNLKLPHIGDAATLAPSGSYIATDGVQRIYSFRRMADYPLVLAVGTSLAEALARYEANRRVYTWLAAAFTVVILIALLSLIVSFDRLLTLAESHRQSAARAERAHRSKAEFLASLSLELRAPLRSIRSFAEQMERKLEGPAAREQALSIRRAAEQLSGALNDILDMSRIEAGVMEIAPRPADIRDLLRRSVARWESAPAARGREVSVALDVDVPARARWDAARVEQVLHCLLSSAAAAGGREPVALQVTRHGEQIVLTVDGGRTAAAAGGAAGLPQSADAATGIEEGLSSRPHGSSLALALSRSFAQLMSGDLTADATSGANRFVLTLPIGEVPPLEARSPLPLAA